MLNPNKGVVKKHVTIPLVEDCIVDIPTPLLLLTVNKFLLLKLSPVGCSKILTAETELDWTSVVNIPSLILSPVTESTIATSGGVV